jgi:hypothetical protein
MNLGSNPYSLDYDQTICLNSIHLVVVFTDFWSQKLGEEKRLLYPTHPFVKTESLDVSQN